MNLLVVLGLVWVAVQDDDRERLRAKQKEVRELLDRVERTVTEISGRLEQKDPDGTKRLRDAWSAMKKNYLQDKMKEVEGLIDAKKYLDAIKQINEIITKLEEILRLLMGSMEKEEDPKPKLAELKKELDDLLKKEQENKSKLDELKKETTGSLDDLSDRLQKAIDQQKELQKDTQLIPPPSILQQLKEILAKIVTAKEHHFAVKTAADQEAVSKETQAIDPAMKKLFQEMHAYGPEVAHKFKSAHENIQHAGLDMAEAAKLFDDPLKAPGFVKASTSHLKISETLIREIIATLEEREKLRPQVEARQGQLSKDIEKMKNDAAKLGESSDSPIKDSLEKAAQSLDNANKSSDQAKDNAAKSDPKGATDKQSETGKGMEEAKKAVDEARRAKESQMTGDQKKRLQDIEKQQGDLSKQAQDLARKMADNPAGKNVEGAQNSMDKAAEKMGQQGQQPQEGQQGEPNLSKATEHQKDAIEQLEKAKDDVNRQNREQSLGALEKRLVKMIEEQKKINQTTLDLDMKKKQMGQLMRSELDTLLAAGMKEEELSKIALECKGICDAAEAFEMGWAFDMVSKEMVDVHKLLKENKTDNLTQRKEQFILKTLEALLQAVKEKQREGPQEAKKNDGQQPGDENKNPNDQGQNQGDPQEQQAQNEMLGVEAEIRLIIEMQKHLREQVDEIGRANAKRDTLEALHLEIMQELKKRQTDLLDRLEQVISRVGVQETQKQVERKKD